MREEWCVPLDLVKVRTFPLARRPNLVTRADLADPGAAPSVWDHPELNELVDRLAAACRDRKTLIWSMGAHVIKAGLGPYVIELVRRGLVNHVAGNGAVAIHDFELALVGGTSENVPDALETGTFGMWEETGRFMLEALGRGVAAGWGYGRALGAYMAEHPERFPHRDVSVIWNAFEARVPLTIHITIGADIVHQHPAADFAVLGEASGTDFKIYCRSVSRLEGGAFLNFGSAVTGPEVFLKALSIARNLGHRVERFTTANFDIVALGDYRRAVAADQVRAEYYYRPWKNIVVRPPSLGGKGFHIEGRHQDTVPTLYRRLRDALGS